MSEVFPPERTATARFVGEAALSLADRFDIVVIAGRMRYVADDAVLARELGDKGVVVRRPRGGTTKANTTLGRLWQTLQTIRYMAVTGRREARHADYVMCVTNPPVAPIVASLCARAANVPLVIRVDDVYPEALSAAGVVRRASPLFRVLDWLLTRPLRAARRIIVLGRDARELIERKVASRVPVEVIPNFATVPFAAFDAAHGADLRVQLGLHDKFVVGYLGNFGRTHDIQTILRAAAHLKAERPGIHFLLMGEGAQYEDARARVGAEGLSNVTLRRSCSDEELAGYLQLPDVAVISFPPGMRGVSVPSRLYNHLAAGRPIVGVCDDESELAMVLRESSAGWIVPPRDAAALARRLTELASHAEAVRAAGERGREAVEHRYTRSIVDGAYRRLADSLAGSLPAARPA
jgi:colanic acid biosynthesis glycosyl transferase WcaI